MNRNLLGLLLVVVALLPGCASVAHTRDPAAELALVESHAGAPVRSVTLLTLDDFEVLGDYTLLLWERRTKAYLIEVDRPCTGLKFAFSMQLDRQPPWLSADIDAILLRDNERCYIKSIRPVAVPALKAARRVARANRRE